MALLGEIIFTHTQLSSTGMALIGDFSVSWVKIPTDELKLCAGEMGACAGGSTTGVLPTGVLRLTAALSEIRGSC